MTDTEAKALALELRDHACKFYSNMAQSNLWSALITAADYIETTAATEARHAAEMRELKERFSDVLGRIKAGCIPAPYRPKFEMFAAPFILPAPDPLAEALASLPENFAGCVDGADNLRAAMQARGYEWRKIGEAGE